MGFNEQAWALCRQIPTGKVSTYGEIARAMGTKAYRAVGNALNKNPYGAVNCRGSEMVPCHRVVDANGHLRGYAHGLRKKAQLLEEEGVVVQGEKVYAFQDVRHYF
jgi:methylated-DNA-[protein]-cysteine S-methyltransferase